MPTPRQQPNTDRATEETILAVGRAFAVLDMLADEETGLSLAEIARRMGVNKAIAVRQLGSLVALGYVWRDDIAQTYQLTYKISNLGLRQMQRGRLLDLASAQLRSLADDTGELARLAVVENGERITWVFAAVGRKRSLRIDPNYSLAISLSTHASGRAWLATLPDERALELMREQGIEKRTPYSRTDETDILAALEETRERGFAFSFQENELGVGAVGAAILARRLDGEAACVGSVTLAAPTNRLGPDELFALGPQVVEVAKRLGGSWPIDDVPTLVRARELI